jgi:antitoxin component YwqK of YwqJK toxin-antitoxin module
MSKIIYILFVLFLLSISSIAQTQEKIIYFVDSIPVREDPEEGNEISESDIADFSVIKNRDTLNRMGFEKFGGAIFIFTKAYRDRPEDLKRIPSSKQMERIDGLWHYRNKIYSGPFIDYYYSGRKEGEGVLKEGRVEGLRRMYHQNSQLALERMYVNGIENGLEKEYYEDGSLKQKGTFVNGKEDGIWEMYYPNGQVKQRSNFKDGIMEGETSVYYSNGKLLAVEVSKNGRTTPDKKLEKIEQALNKGHMSSQEGDYKTAIKNYSKAIEIDSSYAEAYFSRGTVKLNNFQFDEAILDFNKALTLEPYLEKALANRAFARIRKHQFASSRKLSENSGVTVLASKDNPGIPENEIVIICSDLRLAVILGDKAKMTKDALNEFCGTKSSR